MTGDEIIKAVEDALDHIDKLDSQLIELRQIKRQADLDYYSARKHAMSIAAEIDETTEAREGLVDALKVLRAKIFNEALSRKAN